MNKNITFPKSEIATFCRKHKITRLAVFGSALREDFSPDSDIDVLVNFKTGQEPGFFALARMERELSKILGRQADLRTPEDLSELFRNEVIQTAQLQYAG